MKNRDYASHQEQGLNVNFPMPKAHSRARLDVNSLCVIKHTNKRENECNRARNFIRTMFLTTSNLLPFNY